MSGYDYDGTGEVIALCPTRENAEGALEMVRSFYETVRRIGTEVILVVDADDPQRADYEAIPTTMARELVGMGITRPEPIRVMIVEGGSLTKATNEAVERLWDVDSIVGHVGDDHRFRTEGWDHEIRLAIQDGAAVAYAWDGFKSAWASAWWTPMIVVRTLGWLALPGTRHLTIDDCFMDIGAGLGATPEERLAFLPEVLIEHLHPAGGKVPWRPIVRSHYSAERRYHDESVLTAYRAGQFAEDIGRLRDALHLPHYPVTDLTPGVTFRRAMRGKWAQYAVHVVNPVPSDEMLIELNGGNPIKGLPQRLRLINAWHRKWREDHPDWNK